MELLERLDAPNDAISIYLSSPLNSFSNTSFFSTCDTFSFPISRKHIIIVSCALNYVNNEQLPEGKMELYEKCCEMLMDARDNQRKIDGNIYEHLLNLNYEIKLYCNLSISLSFSIASFLRTDLCQYTINFLIKCFHIIM